MKVAMSPNRGTMVPETGCGKGGSEAFMGTPYMGAREQTANAWQGQGGGLWIKDRAAIRRLSSLMAN
jgi:hypothetical protein